MSGAAVLGNQTPAQSPALISITPSTAVQVQKSDTASGQKANGNSGGTQPNASAQKSSTPVNPNATFLEVANSDGKKPAPQAPPATPDTSQPNANSSQQDNAQRPAPAPPANPANPANPNPSPSGNSPQGTSTTSNTPAPSAVAAVSLVRMNEDYFDLDMNFVQQLLVACVNEYDPTRVRLPLDHDPATAAASLGTPSRIQSTAQAGNTFLRQLCPSLSNVQTLVTTEQMLLSTLTATGHPASNVEPDLGLEVSSPAPQNNSPSPTPVKKKKPTKQHTPAQKSHDARRNTQAGTSSRDAT